MFQAYMIVLDYAPSLRPTLYCPLVQPPNSLFHKDLAYFRAGGCRCALALNPLVAPEPPLPEPSSLLWKLLGDLP